MARAGVAAGADERGVGSAAANDRHGTRVTTRPAIDGIRTPLRLAGGRSPDGLRRVGHKGADAIVAGNTPASFDAAIAAGADAIELDVLSERPDGSGPLRIAHDYSVIDGAPTLQEGLDHLTGEPFAATSLDVDLKLPGYERRVVDALRERGLADRSLLSSTHPASLRVVRAHAPELPLGWSVPRVRRDYTATPLTLLPALAVVRAWRATLPRRARQALQGGLCDAVMAHWRLVSRALVRTVADAGGELYVWTVDDPALVRRLRALGVDAIISNDPRLLS